MPPCSGGGTPSSTRSTCPASPIPTATASATCEGIRGRLGYLELLGVDALWLSPIYASPMVDNGYDITDHRSVDPAWGDLDAFDELIADAHAHGIRVTVDLVPNHTSDQHPWFRAALASPTGSPERDRYHFRTGPGRRRHGAAQQLAQRVRRVGVDPRAGARRGPGRVVPAPVLARPARPELDEPGGLGGPRQDAAVLAGPRRRRLPHRRRARHVQAELRPGPRRRSAATTTRASTRTTCTTSTG